MATKLELQIELDADGAIRSVKSLDNSLDGLDTTTRKTDKATSSLFKTFTLGNVAANLLNRGLNQVGGELVDCFTEALEAEKVQLQLNSALAAGGKDVEIVGDQVDEFASQLQSLTGVTDEEIKSLSALSYTFGISGDKMQEAVRGAVGLTNLYGGSLRNNLEAVARAYQGQWRQADALIPELRTLHDDGQKLTVLQEKMAQGFKASTDAMQGMGGKITTIKNQWADFKEAVGTGLLTLFDGFSKLGNAFNDSAWRYERLKAMRDAEANARDVAAAKSQKYVDVVLDETEAITSMNAVQEGLALGMMQYVGLLPVVTEQEKKHTETTARLVEKKRELLDMLPQLTDWESQYRQEALDPAAAALEKLGQVEVEVGENAITMDGEIQDSSDSVKKWTIDWQDANEVLKFAGQCIDQVESLLSELGVELGKTGEGFMDAAEGAITLAQGVKSGNPLSIISGGLKIVTGLVKAFAGDGIGEAIKRENQWMKLNKDLEKQLRDLAEQVGDTHEATSIMLDDIIEQTEITVDTFDEWAVRLREILSDLDRGNMSMGEATSEMGDAFDALIEKAKDLGTEGSNTLLTFFDDLANRGIEVAEVTKYINEQLSMGLEGYKKYLAGDFSTATIGVFESLLAYEKKIGENQELIDGIDGITQALVGLSNTTRLTEEEFDQFELAASDAYNKLTAQGFTARESLTELAPMLSRLKFLHDEYGLTVDAATQALLDQAQAENINLDNYRSQEEIFSDMSDSLAELVNIFRNVFPGAIQQTTNAFVGLNGAASDLINGKYILPDIETPDIHAASGFYSPRLGSDTVIQAHRGESVMVTPRSQVGDGTSRETNINVALNGVITPEAVADAFLAAYRANKRGLRSTLQEG